MGAAGGALIGSVSANAGKGASIGAGALGGYLYDQHRKGNINELCRHWPIPGGAMPVPSASARTLSVRTL